MSDTDELERIRERKRERLKREREQDGGDGTPDVPVDVGGGSQLADLVAEHDVVLADFYADWCGPCRALEPAVESVAAETTAAVGTVDIDANRELAAEYGVRSVPTLLLFADGDVVERLVGVQQEGRLRDLVAGYA
jgi:thioredoxin 1